ncbi:MAG: spondin domain-containing protein [Acidimicrobiia bacterium]
MSRSSRTITLAMAAALAVSTLGLTALAEEPLEAVNTERTYRVTVTNLTDGQPMTPFVVATHQSEFSMFARGQSASFGLQQLAENGGVPVLVEELTANSAVADVAVAAPAAGPPVHPGESVSVDVTAHGEARWITLAGMLICTNDGFGGVSNVKLPTVSKTVYGYAYDAGTEVNTESYADLVPPCDSSGMTGETNPALAENAAIHRHPGISGIANLDPAIHGWSGPVIMVEIELIK